MGSHLGRLVAGIGGLAVSASTLFGCEGGCNRSPTPTSQPSASASPGVMALSPQMRARVLAEVGDKKITLGQYVATLERMNEFERLRYQSPDRRKLLLEEMIQAELLAGEARRRGLDKQPKTRAALRQILRDELLRQVRNELPKPEQLPAAEVQAYYKAHQQEFQEPERRRLAHLQLSSLDEGKQLLQEALTASPKVWGKLVRQHSRDRRAPSALGDPDEFAGDLGIVATPGVEGGENPKVPEPLRQAAFKIDKIGGVYPELVEHQGSFHIVRLIGKTDARTRSVKEAERMIRVRLLEQRLAARERELEQELRQQFKVVVDQNAMKQLKIPAKGQRPE